MKCPLFFVSYTLFAPERATQSCGRAGEAPPQI
jgi:hypothetical protein